jgi:hypothetical protein
MRLRLLRAVLIGLFLWIAWGCSNRESGAKKIDRDPFKERNMKAPRVYFSPLQPSLPLDAVCLERDQVFTA